MAMRKWSVIEDDLKKAQHANDPRLLHYLGEIHERLREQHQQIMALAEYVDKQSILMQTMTQGFNSAQDLIKKLAPSKADEVVKSLEGSEEEEGSTYDLFRTEPGRKN